MLLPAQCFIGASVLEKPVDVVEVGEVGINLYHPVWLCQKHSANEGPARILWQERLYLDPSNDIVQRPRDVQRYCAD